jgi:O-antigen/teichoic acid export membrane protein
VGQQISRQLANSILLWTFNKWRPVIEFSKKSFKELFGYGSKILLSGIIDTVYKNIYYIIIGKFYSSAQLGQYTRAESFNTIFSSNLTAIVQRVSYPVLSSIQDDNERLRQAYRKVIKTTMLISFACMLGLAAIAKPLIMILLVKNGCLQFLFSKSSVFQECYIRYMR